MLAETLTEKEEDLEDVTAIVFEFENESDEDRDCDCSLEPDSVFSSVRDEESVGEIVTVEDEESLLETSCDSVCDVDREALTSSDCDMLSEKVAVGLVVRESEDVTSSLLVSLATIVPLMDVLRLAERERADVTLSEGVKEEVIVGLADVEADRDFTSLALRVTV